MPERFKLESFNHAWSECYEQESARVLPVLGLWTEGGLIWRMVHVGSIRLENVSAAAEHDILKTFILFS